MFGFIAKEILAQGAMAVIYASLSQCWARPLAASITPLQALWEFHECSLALTLASHRRGCQLKDRQQSVSFFVVTGLGRWPGLAEWLLLLYL